MMNTSKSCDLQKHEVIIDAAHRYRLLEAQALRTIRQQRLYFPVHKTFEVYCRHRWGFTRIQGRRLCAWAEVAENLLPIGCKPPGRESHARPLSALTPDQQRRAWILYLGTKPTIHKAEAIDRLCRKVQQTPVAAGMLPPTLAAGETAHAPRKQASASATVPVISPVSWFGSKAKLVTRYVDLLPTHKRYIEGFSGSAALLFRKQPAKIEIVNDLNGDIVNLFRVLRDSDSARELQRLLKLTPYARDEHNWCRTNPDSDDPIEQARRFVVRCRQSFSGIVDAGWSLAFSKNRAFDFSSPADQIEAITARLRNVQVENRDFRKFLPKTDLPETAIFLDPPYLPSLRSGQTKGMGIQYQHEMSGDDHVDLLEIVTKFTNAKVLLCGYPSKLYDKHLGGWKRFEFKTGVRASEIPEGVNRTVERTEVVWTNF